MKRGEENEEESKESRLEEKAEPRRGINSPLSMRACTGMRKSEREGRDNGDEKEKMKKSRGRRRGRQFCREGGGGRSVCATEIFCHGREKGGKDTKEGRTWRRRREERRGEGRGGEERRGMQERTTEATLSSRERKRVEKEREREK